MALQHSRLRRAGDQAYSQDVVDISIGLVPFTAGPALADVVDQALKVLLERNIAKRLPARRIDEALLAHLLQLFVHIFQVRVEAGVRRVGSFGRRISASFLSDTEEHLVDAMNPLSN